MTCPQNIIEKATYAYEDAEGHLSVEERMKIALDAVWDDLVAKAKAEGRG